MNYCEHHLGDYARRTGAFSMLEHGAYAKLRDRYFVTEQPIPAADVYRQAGARTKPERDAVDVVLVEFFRRDGDAWRCDEFDAAVDKAHNKTRAAQENGKRGGRPKRTEPEPDGNPPGSKSVPQQKALQTPNTITTEANASVVAKRASRKCPSDFEITEALADWAAEKTPGVALDAETEKFRDHTFRTAITDWPGAWRNWMRRAGEHAPHARVVTLNDRKSRQLETAALMTGATRHTQQSHLETIDVDARIVPARALG